MKFGVQTYPMFRRSPMETTMSNNCGDDGVHARGYLKVRLRACIA